jgi:voltage-gated potassium channel
VLCAGVTVYLMLGLLWGLAYALIAVLVPNSFVFNAGPAVDHRMGGFEALYFSFITLSTIGYGDIVPVSKRPDCSPS